MRAATFPLALAGSASTALFVRIAQAIAQEIARGRLSPGDALPGTRSLAQTLGVHRSTVVAAYAELTAQGWVGTRPGGATYVATKVPERAPRRFAKSAEPRKGVPERAGFQVDAMPVRTPAVQAFPGGGIQLRGGTPDLRLVPVDLLARAYRRTARRSGHELLGYALDGRGHRRLRAAIAAMVSTTRGLAAKEDDVLITRGSQMALDLVARALLSPGDLVAVEALGYAHAINVFRRAGAEVVPIEVDQHGLDVDALAHLSRQRRVRLVYVTPHHQYPTTVGLSPTRRLALLALAQREKIAIVEDDYDQEFHYDGRPVLPLASSDAAGNVIYVGTLAKILAPGLRLGFVVAPAPLLRRMHDERMLLDRQGDAVLECAVAELLEDGEIQRHVRRMRRVYHDRRDALCDALDRQFAGLLSYTRPAGGLALWARVAPSIDLAAWFARSAERGVHFQIGEQFTFDGRPAPFARLGFAALDKSTLTEAIKRLTESLPQRKRPNKRAV